MMKSTGTVVFSAILGVALVTAQSSKYSPLNEYMMDPGTEMALARSAAPDNISDHATIKVLTPAGYKAVVEGDNGFVCIVMRGWSAPTFTPAENLGLVYDSKLRAPICFDPVASRTVLPFQELRTKLGMKGEDPDAIAAEVAKAYALGELPKMEGCVVRLHVVDGLEPWTRSGCVASAHDGLRALLHELDPGEQQVWKSSALRE